MVTQSFLDRSFLWINISCFVILTIVGINYFAPLKEYSILFIVNLLVPFFIFSFLLFGVYWLFRRQKLLVVINVMALVFWYFFMGPYFMISSSTSEDMNRGIKIFSFNTHGLRGKKYDKQIHIIKPLFNDFVKEQDPDIICLQELVDRNNVKYIKNNYIHSYVYKGNKTFSISPLSIYSKYPIINSGPLNFPNTGNGAIYVDLQINKDTLRIYNIHLQSLQVRPGSFKREAPTNLLPRLGGSFAKQLEQAKLIKEHYSTSPYKSIICGDFNTTQYSGAFRMISEGMKDSFIEKGTGYGTTYDFKFLPFRIDFVLTDKDIDIIDHRNYDIEISDHYPIMATFNLN